MKVSKADSREMQDAETVPSVKFSSRFDGAERAKLA